MNPDFGQMLTKLTVVVISQYMHFVIIICIIY